MSDARRVIEAFFLAMILLLAGGSLVGVGMTLLVYDLVAQILATRIRAGGVGGGLLQAIGMSMVVWAAIYRQWREILFGICYIGLGFLLQTIAEAESGGPRLPRWIAVGSFGVALALSLGHLIVARMQRRWEQGTVDGPA